jgi:hypothetical protein
MSSAPNDPWPPPTSSSASPGANLWWRVRHSWWLLLPVLGFSCLGGSGFVYVGIRARRPAWWIAGIVYIVVGWAAFLVVGESDEASALSDWGVGVFLAVWIASILHAILINPSWLRWRAGQRPWYAQPPAAPIYPGGSYPQPPPAPPPGAYYGGGPVAAPIPQPAQPMDEHPPPVRAAVDVNTARIDEFAALPGFDTARARHLVAEREARRGFGSVAEFAAAANLAPHEFAPLRDILVCAPRQAPAPNAGQPPHGRVLDV